MRDVDAFGLPQHGQRCLFLRLQGAHHRVYFMPRRAQTRRCDLRGIEKQQRIALLAKQSAWVDALIF